jgi:FtsP/CotA-like multicopper oxidase with cupredoxin domain
VRFENASDLKRWLAATALAIALLSAGCARAPGASTTAIPPTAPELRAVRGLLAFRLDAVLDARGAPAFSYDGHIGVAPTLRLEPGDRLALTVHNAMVAQPHFSNDVNLHFHGLAISPRAPADEVLTTIAHPGETLTYRFKIPRDHEPGLYWYHPHIHGQTFWQVAHGMSGAIVIEGLQRHLPALAAMRERIIMLRQRPSGSDITEPGNAPNNPEALEDSDGNPCRPELALQPSIDGVARERIDIAPGERQFFRVVNASASRYFDLSIDGETLQLVALDGVPLDAYPGSPPVAKLGHVVIAPAGRAEFVVTGPEKPSVLRSACVDSGPAGDAQTAAILADILPTGSPVAASAPSLTTIGARLPRNPNAPPPPAPALRRLVRLTEDAKNFYINGKSFSMAAMMAPPAFVARAGTVEEWDVVNDTDEVHDFHIHQVHFAVEGVNGVANATRHWVDTASVPSRIHHFAGTEPSHMRILVDFRNPIVRGTFLFHCHILDHEDRGMMAKIEVR